MGLAFLHSVTVRTYAILNKGKPGIGLLRMLIITWEKAGLKYIFSGELIRVFETKLRTLEVVFTLPFFLLPESLPVERIFHFIRGILIIP